MRSTLQWVVAVALGAFVVAPAVVPAHQHDLKELPAGPIRDRHELMESIGQQAKNINDAFNVGVEGFDTGIIQRAGTAIAMSAARIPGLFPKGSTDPHSRALPAIWDNWDKFDQLAKDLEHEATSLANAAGSEQDEKLKEKANKMFATCKSCHDQFRRPEKNKKGS
jgi:cytochrome c556